MKNYLSFGGGVNSVALHLYLLDEGWDFEAVFVNHGTDWPETYEYFDMFQEWLDKRDCEPITELKPDVDGFDNLYDYCKNKNIVPSKMFRWCTDKFKVRVLSNYYQKPCFNLLGIDFGEQNRAKINCNKGIENRFPLIEAEINRTGCKSIIKKHGLFVPPKSGCYICPFQGFGQVVELRLDKPDLFCKIEALESSVVKWRRDKGKKPLYIFGSGHGVSIKSIVDERQYKLFKQDEYPPCECFL